MAESNPQNGGITLSRGVLWTIAIFFGVVTSIAGWTATEISGLRGDLQSFRDNTRNQFDVVAADMSSMKTSQAVMAERMDGQARMRDEIEEVRATSRNMQEQIHRLELLIRERETRTP